MVSPLAAWAVGAAYQHGLHQVIDHWDGTTWQSSFFGDLGRVAAVTTTPGGGAWAVGMDPSDQLVRFSTTTVRIKGRNLLLNPRAALHVPGKDFFNFAVVSGPATLAVPMDPDDAAVEKLFAIHEGLGAASDRDGFGAQMLADHRMAVEFRVEHIYGQILDR